MSEQIKTFNDLLSLIDLKLSLNTNGFKVGTVFEESLKDPTKPYDQVIQELKQLEDEIGDNDGLDSLRGMIKVLQVRELVIETLIDTHLSIINNPEI